ncbi:hypothetical protein PIB30_074158 [Stylosanthes scabra]|uniref:Uncharacterized protein n=1 Tax=Stylosanthes scabra TaxID=79078 RepID=A0ABU6VN06_9FABA|nr:hypothetical protein [Stylosanthes scabra]
MPRFKRPIKKPRGASSSMEPPPQDHPLAQWFYNKENFDLYLSDFAPRKVVPPRYLEPNFFDQHHYPNLLGILVRQNLVNYMKIKDCYYPDLIAIAYTTLDVEFEENDMINWVHLIVTHMRRIKPGNSKGLPYAILWTALFKYVGIDLSQANKKKLGYNHCIDTHVLNHMKRNEHEAPQQEEEAQPQEPHDNPSEQPSMRDLMELIQSMEHNMGTRLERIEQNQTRMSQRIRRMEQYLYSEDEGDDEDEDQD